ncbi:MAG: tetratricopeptide repeat protein [Polyangiaceae bacterium]
MTSLQVCSVALAALLAATGCVSSRAARFESRVETSRRESEPRVLIERGQAFAGAGDYARAAQYLRAALQQHGDPELILPLLVAVEIKDMSYRSASQHLENWLRTHPSDVRARFVFASLLRALDRPKDAEQELLGILKRDPRDADATFALAVVYRDGLRHYERADDYFRRYLDLAPEGKHREEAMSSTMTGLP